MVTLLKKFKTQGDSLTLPGTVLVQIPLLQESHTPQQQTCPSQKAQAHHFQHPDWKEYTATGKKIIKDKELEIGHHKCYIYH